jgi:hypothetical protein
MGFRVIYGRTVAEIILDGTEVLMTIRTRGPRPVGR